MKIRRNYEGHMLFIDALELLNTCIQNGVLTGEVNKSAIVYHSAGKNTPAGWYKHDIEDLASEVMRDDEVIKLLINALSEKGVAFEPSFNASLLDSSLLQEPDEEEGNVDDEAETVFDGNGCPENCPCLDTYPDCYCKHIAADEETETHEAEVMETEEGTRFVVLKEINPEWSEYDMSIARIQLSNYGEIYVDDEYLMPIDNEYDIMDIRETREKV